MRPLQAHCHRGLARCVCHEWPAGAGRAALATSIALSRAMEMTFWLPQAEAALMQLAAPKLSGELCTDVSSLFGHIRRAPRCMRDDESVIVRSAPCLSPMKSPYSASRETQVERPEVDNHDV